MRKFRRFERVLFTGARPGEYGVIIWADYVMNSRWGRGTDPPPRNWREWVEEEPFPRRWSEWTYSVFCPQRDCYGNLLEEYLRSIGVFDAEEDHQGEQFEISFDCFDDDDAGVIEGCYRLPGQSWCVLAYCKEDVAT